MVTLMPACFHWLAISCSTLVSSMLGRPDRVRSRLAAPVSALYGVDLLLGLVEVGA